MQDVANWLAAPGYEVGRWLLQRGLAVTYALAWLNVWNQWPALLGETGLLPAGEVLGRRSFRESPGLLHWRHDDRFVRVVAAVGLALSIGLVFGLGDWLPLPAAVAAWLVLWFLYLSIVNAGRVFYSFGWESLLVEAGWLAAFLGNDDVAPSLVVIVALRWLLFRVEFGAGLIKWRGDPCWRDLTCLDFHHETQPMPGPLSWWFHHLPPRLHRVEVAANHVTQLALPWLLLLPQPAAGAAGAAVVVTQAWLMVSGNYAWLNFVTLLLGLAVIPDAWFTRLGIGAPGQDPGAGPTWWLVVVVLVGLVVVARSWAPARNLVSRRQHMNASFDPWRLVNAYGAFGSVTRTRREVVIEGSAVDQPGEGDWRAWEFRGKPTDPMRRPRQYAPYHLRLDWLLWFIPLSPGHGAGWFSRLCNRLLVGDEQVLALLADNPFPDDPPTWVRARMVDYRFTSPAERRRTGAWWVTGRSRTLVSSRRRHQDATATRTRPRRGRPG